MRILRYLAMNSGSPGDSPRTARADEIIDLSLENALAPVTHRTPTLFIIGDGHGCALKLLIALLDTRLFTLPEGNFEEFKNFYQDLDLNAPDYFIAVLDFILRLNPLQNLRVHPSRAALGPVEFVSAGDNFSDRGKSDAVFAYVVMSAVEQGTDHRITFSPIIGNHCLHAFARFRAVFMPNPGPDDKVYNKVPIGIRAAQCRSATYEKHLDPTSVCPKEYKHLFSAWMRTYLEISKCVEVYQLQPSVPEGAPRYLFCSHAPFSIPRFSAAFLGLFESLRTSLPALIPSLEGALGAMPPELQTFFRTASVSLQLVDFNIYLRGNIDRTLFCIDLFNQVSRAVFLLNSVAYPEDPLFEASGTLTDPITSLFIRYWNHTDSESEGVVAEQLSRRQQLKDFCLNLMEHNTSYTNFFWEGRDIAETPWRDFPGCINVHGHVTQIIPLRTTDFLGALTRVNLDSSFGMWDPLYHPVEPGLYTPCVDHRASLFVLQCQYIPRAAVVRLIDERSLVGGRPLSRPPSFVLPPVDGLSSPLFPVVGGAELMVPSSLAALALPPLGSALAALALPPPLPPTPASELPVVAAESTRSAFTPVGAAHSVVSTHVPLAGRPPLHRSSAVSSPVREVGRLSLPLSGSLSYAPYPDFLRYLEERTPHERSLTPDLRLGLAHPAEQYVISRLAPSTLIDLGVFAVTLHSRGWAGLDYNLKSLSAFAHRILPPCFRERLQALDQEETRLLGRTLLLRSFRTHERAVESLRNNYYALFASLVHLYVFLNNAPLGPSLTGRAFVRLEFPPEYQPMVIEQVQRKGFQIYFFKEAERTGYLPIAIRVCSSGRVVSADLAARAVSSVSV